MNKEFFHRQLGQAIALAARLFESKVDKQGKPYILHCLAVMNAIDNGDPELQVCAVLHDITEDITTYDIERLKIELALTGRQEIVLRLLDHNPTTSYEDYIKIISNDEDAVKVKRADLEHNSNITRLKGLRKKDFERLEKYHKAYVYLSN